jgi:hypothetical protein
MDQKLKLQKGEADGSEDEEEAEEEGEEGPRR